MCHAYLITTSMLTTMVAIMGGFAPSKYAQMARDAAAVIHSNNRDVDRTALFPFATGVDDREDRVNHYLTVRRKAHATCPVPSVAVKMWPRPLPEVSIGVIPTLFAAEASCDGSSHRMPKLPPLMKYFTVDFVGRCSESETGIRNHGNNATRSVDRARGAAPCRPS